MAQWDTYNLKSSPEDGDSLMIKDESETLSATKNKRIKFSGLWNWIVDKLVNATIEALSTSQKTVVGGLNELKDKFAYEEVTNWNNFKPSVNRGIKHGISVSDSASNQPFTGDNATFYGWVEGVATYCTQHLTVQYATSAFNRNREFTRSYLTNSWTPWAEVTHSGDGVVPNNTDLDDYIQPGVYIVSSAYTYSNAPGAGVMEVICPTVGGTYCIQRIETSTRIWQRYRSGESGTAWSEWVEIPRRAEIDALAGLNTIYKGSLAASGDGASVSITGTGTHSIYIVAVGTWNYSRILVVFPANGGEPRVKPLSWYAASDTAPSDIVAITAGSGVSGITIENLTSASCPITVYALIKTN